MHLKEHAINQLQIKLEVSVTTAWSAVHIGKPLQKSFFLTYSDIGQIWSEFSLETLGPAAAAWVRLEVNQWFSCYTSTCI